MKQEEEQQEEEAAAPEGGTAGEGEAEDESWDHKRGRKRAGSPVKTEEEDSSAYKKVRSDSEVSIIPGQENQDTFDKSLVVLDWCK